jgi:Ni/Fe-hydrogenase 1 B-type cytochrome subunit
MKTKPHKLRRVFVWELPVRIYHWLNALMIVVLCVTGYLIGNPPAIMSSAEASDQYLFGWIRFIHFGAAYIFLFGLILRIYWLFVGNKYARWPSFVPTSIKDVREIWNVIRIDILLKKNKDHMSVGHNALAGFIYLFVFLASIFQVFTGFGLYASMSDFWMVDLFVWVPDVFGGDFATRNWHHVVMWFFVVFTMIHVYLVAYHDYVEGRGETSSIVGGWKFIEEDAWMKDEQENQELEEQARKKRQKVVYNDPTKP